MYHLLSIVCNLHLSFSYRNRCIAYLYQPGASSSRSGEREPVNKDYAASTLFFSLLYLVIIVFPHDFILDFFLSQPLHMNSVLLRQ